ncbi:MAG TPA: hypothetical protein VJY35_05560 [Candidatus Eisenbacteria bacterium]|nr:hypothetical protein [Candidatus Eisenbacteria bacterium]
MIKKLTDVVTRLVQDILVRLQNPTRDLPATTFRALAYDLRNRSLNGVPLDASFSVAAPFGKADWFSGMDDPDLDYRALGLQIGTFQGLVASFRIIVDPAACGDPRERAFRPGALSLSMPGGGQLEISNRTREEDLIAALGAPAETGSIVGAKVHSFVVAGQRIDSYHHPSSGRLRELTICLSGEATELRRAA